MKDPIEVLRSKEAELLRLQEEVEALRMVGKLLKDYPKESLRDARAVVLQMPSHPFHMA